MPAAPAPAKTTFTSSILRLVSSSAFRNAAPEMIAVPCWSSWKTGMSTLAISLSSISKQSGARMSSRLMPPNVGSSSLQTLDHVLRVLASDLDVEHVDAGEALEQDGLALHHGLAGSGPMLPRPSTAVPLVTTATRLPRAV